MKFSRMTIKINYLSIENFRSIEHKTEFQFSPVTILTGKNSSGKSTVIHALNLLKNEILNPNKQSFTRLRINELSNHLGSFKSILTRHSNKNTIAFEYPFIGKSNNINDDYFKSEWKVKVVYHLDDINREEGRLQLLTLFHQEKGEFIKVKLNSEQTGYGVTIDIQQLINAKVELYLKMKSTYRKEALFQLGSDISSKEIDLQWDLVTSFYSDGYEISERWFKEAHTDNEAMNELIGHYPFLTRYVSLDDGPKYPLSWEQTELYSNLMDEVAFFFRKLMQQNKLLFNFKFLGSVRGVSKRVYLNNDPYAISESALDFFYSNFAEDSKEILFVNKWLRKFEMGEELIIHREEGTATAIFLLKDDEEILLADLGYGISQFFPILLEVANCSKANKMLIIEEPEANLHPNFQSLLGDFFMDAYKELGVHFILETHSEYFIRKLQYLVGKNSLQKGKKKPEKGATKNDIIIYYFEKAKPPRRIQIQDDGRLDQEFGQGFYDEANNLSMELMRLNYLQKN